MAIEQGDLSPEYYSAFHNLVMAHGLITQQVKDEIHLKARGSAGGKGKAKAAQAAIAATSPPPDPGGDPAESQEGGESKREIIIESIQMGGPGVRREGKYLIAPIHLTHEGVANRGLKKWEEIFDPDEIDGIHSFEGVPVLRGHPGFMSGPKPALGRLQNVTGDKKTKRADCEARLVEQRLTGVEKARLLKGEYVAGSIGYEANKFYHKSPQQWEDGEEYEWEVRHPLRGNHYALLEDGDEPACPTCGFNAPKESVESEEKDGSKEEFELRLVGNTVTKCPKKKQEDIDNMTPEELQTIIAGSVSSAMEKALQPVTDRLAALEKKELDVTKIPAFVTMQESVAKLQGSTAELETLKAERAEERAQKERDDFGLFLKAAYLDAEGKPRGEAFEKVFTEAKAHPRGTMGYIADHPEIRAVHVEQRQLKGLPNAGNVPEFDLALEQKKLFFGDQVR